jgi:PAS domain S-box-containing protein
VKSTLRLPARLVILTFVLGGAAAVAARFPEINTWTQHDLLTCVGLIVAVSITEQFAVRLHYGKETWNFSLTDAVWASALLLARPGVLTMSVAVGVVLGQGVKRWNPYKIAFNVGQFLVAMTVARAVFAALHPESVVQPYSWLAALVAMAAFFMVNAGAIALIISVVEEKPFLSVLLPPIGLNFVHWGGNVAIGILGAVVWSTHPLGVPLLVVPLFLSYLAYGAWSEGMRERDRMKLLYEASQSLARPLGAGEDYRPFLTPVQRMLNAAAVELVIVREGRATVHTPDGTLGLSPAVVAEGAPQSAEAFVRVVGGLAPHVAMIDGEGGMQGALAVYRQKPLSQAERDLLETLTSQVAVRLENVRLYFQTVMQRSELEDIIGHTSNGIFVVSPEGRIQSWNPAMERITGFGQGEAVSRPFEDILGVSWTLVASDAESKGASSLAGPRPPHDVRLITKDGTARYVRYTTNAILDQDEGVRANVVVARDVTSELEAEELKADFIATVSHELRTPLTPLKGFASALLQGTVADTPEARQEYYRIMLNHANRLERLITDLLDVARMESGAPPVTMEAVEVTALLAEQTQEFAQAQPTHRIRLRAPGLPLLVRADPFRLQQVVANLLSNALKYSPEGTDVEVVLETMDGCAVVSVRDQGPGIAVAEQSRVFDRFYRLDNGSTRETGGTGLGLYIAKRFVEAMSGRLWLDSMPGKGSAFSFSLPLATEAALSRRPDLTEETGARRPHTAAAAASRVAALE